MTSPINKKEFIIILTISAVAVAVALNKNGSPIELVLVGFFVFVVLTLGLVLAKLVTRCLWRNKRMRIVVGILLLVLLITNPSFKEFEESGHLGEEHQVRRETNYLLFSVYYCYAEDNEYFAILKNFFRL